MNDETLQQKIRQDVIDRVEHGKIVMRSRAYFVTRAALAIALSLLVLALSAYVLSFIAFSVHESGEQFLLGFGGKGIWTFLALFPWASTTIDFILVLSLEWLLRGFRFGYRISLLALLGIAILASICIASVISVTPLHAGLLMMADRGDLPIIGEMYERIRDSHEDHGIFRGTITSIEGNRIIITHDDSDHDADDGTRTVALPSGYATKPFSVGERVYVFGAHGSSTVQAYGIGRLSPDQ